MAQAPITTIVPFGNIQELPACAAACGHLYDANGACVPPAVPTNQPAIYTSCFCADPRLAAFSTTTGGVCDNACTGVPNGLSSITSWYHSICSIQGNAAGGGGGAAAPGQTTSTSLAPGSTTRPSASHAPPKDWISGHWQWVVMLVILVVGIAGIWIGACIWRRRYLLKRELEKQANSTPHASWGPGSMANESAAGIPMTYTVKNGSSTPNLPTFVSTSEKRKSKGKWFS